MSAPATCPVGITENVLFGPATPQPAAASLLKGSRPKIDIA